jgi:hypothetical protein
MSFPRNSLLPVPASISYASALIPGPAGFARGARVVTRAASINTYAAADDSIPTSSSILDPVIDLPPYGTTSIKP